MHAKQKYKDLIFPLPWYFKIFLQNYTNTNTVDLYNSKSK